MGSTQGKQMKWICVEGEHRCISQYGRCCWENCNGDYVHIYNLRVFTHSRELLMSAISEIRASGWEQEIQIVTDVPWLRKYYNSLGLTVFTYYG